MKRSKDGFCYNIGLSFCQSFLVSLPFAHSMKKQGTSFELVTPPKQIQNIDFLKKRDVCHVSKTNSDCFQYEKASLGLVPDNLP